MKPRIPYKYFRYTENTYVTVKKYQIYRFLHFYFYPYIFKFIFIFILIFLNLFLYPRIFKFIIIFMSVFKFIFYFSQNMYICIYVHCNKLHIHTHIVIYKKIKCTDKNKTIKIYRFVFNDICR